MKQIEERMREPWRQEERPPVPTEAPPEPAEEPTETSGPEEIPEPEAVPQPQAEVPEPEPSLTPEPEAETPESETAAPETESSSETCPHGSLPNVCLLCQAFRPVSETDMIAGEYSDHPDAPFQISHQISMESPEYSSFLENAERREGETDIVGQEAIEAAIKNGDLDVEAGSDKPLSPETAEALRSTVESLKALIDRKTATGGLKYYRILFLEATNDQRFMEAAMREGIIEEGQDGAEQEANITNAFMSGQMSERLNLELLRAHMEEYRRAEKIWTEEIATQKRNLAEQVKAKVEAGEYPPEALKALEKLERMNIQIADAVAMTAEDKDQHGHSDPDENTIMVQHWQANLPEPDFMRQLFLHEATHALEGRSVGVDTDGKVRHLRTGMTYRDRNRSYNWLNEAVAHRLSKEIAGNPEGVSEHDYDDHERLLEALTERVPLKTFLEAYFEDEDPSLPVAERRPKWQALKESLEKKFGPGFIEKLDELARKHGSKAALTRLRDGQGI